MIYFIEYLATQGLMFFMTLSESLFHCFTQKDSLYVDITEQEKLPLWGLPSTLLESNNVEREIVYEPSIMTAEQNSFFQSFLGIDCNDMQDCTELDIIESDVLTMDDWDEQSVPGSVTPKLAATANAKIADYLIGEQLWVAEVVGEEQGFLHVSDGSARAWVDASKFPPIGKGDILSLLVDRTTRDHIYALDIDILQSYSTDFSVDCYYEENVEETWAIA